MARERERGTATMVLSKPVSRIAFLAAKATALGLGLAASLTLTALFSYAYTLLLLGHIAVARYAAMTGLVSLPPRSVCQRRTTSGATTVRARPLRWASARYVGHCSAAASSPAGADRPS